MKALVLSNGELKEREIKSGLEHLQEIVGGYIEIPFLSETLSDNGIDIVINEEGKFIDGIKPEIAVVSRENGMVLDIVYGNCIFVSHDEEGETIGLNEEQMQIVMTELEMEVDLVNNRTLKEFTVRVLFI